MPSRAIASVDEADRPSPAPTGRGAAEDAATPALCRGTTRDDVARLAGTSTAVVSYVLNDGPRPVASATRARVEAAIAQLNYRPNQLARALRAKRSRVLGLVVPDNSNPFFAELARAVEEEAFAAGYLLLLGNSMQDDTRGAAYVRAFSERQVDGLLVIAAGEALERCSATSAALADVRQPIVLLDRQPAAGPPVTAIVVDNEAGGYAATRHLLDHGHRRIACLAGPSELTPSAERHHGWARAMSEAGLAPDSALLTRSAFNRRAGYVAARELLSCCPRPTALFAASDQQGIGVLRAASELGLRVPADLAIVSFDGIPEAAFTTPGLSTVAQPIVEIGQRGVRLLFDRISNPDGPPVHERLPVKLVPRGSCGCPDTPHATGGRVQRLADEGAIATGGVPSRDVRTNTFEPGKPSCRNPVDR